MKTNLGRRPAAGLRIALGCYATDTKHDHQMVLPQAARPATFDRSENRAKRPQDDLRGLSIRREVQKTRCKACKRACKRISGRADGGKSDFFDRVDRKDRVDRVEACGRRTCGRRDWGSGPGRDGRRVSGHYITIVPMVGSRRDLTQASAIYRREEVAHG